MLLGQVAFVLGLQIRAPGNRELEGMAALFETYLVRAAANCSQILMREFYVLSMSKQFDYGRETYRLKQGFMTQAVALGQLESHTLARRVVRDSFEVAEFFPGEGAAWDAAYRRALALWRT